LRGLENDKWGGTRVTLSALEKVAGTKKIRFFDQGSLLKTVKRVKREPKGMKEKEGTKRRKLGTTINSWRRETPQGHALRQAALFSQNMVLRMGATSCSGRGSGTEGREKEWG